MGGWAQKVLKRGNRRYRSLGGFSEGCRGEVGKNEKCSYVICVNNTITVGYEIWKKNLNFKAKYSNSSCE